MAGIILRWVGGAGGDALCNLLSLQNKNVYFTAFKLCNETNKMYDIMERSFGSRFVQTPSQVPAEFFETMFTSITKSIEDSKTLIDLENQSLVSNAKVVPDPYIPEFGGP